MTYPHVEQESKTVKLNVPDYLTPEHQKEVIEANNAVMETVLLCGDNRDCLNCGNEECMKIFERQAKVQGTTLYEMFKHFREQSEADLKAVEEMKRRYAEYERRAIAGTVIRKNLEKAKDDRTGGGLFDIAA